MSICVCVYVGICVCVCVCVLCMESFKVRESRGKKKTERSDDVPGIGYSED